MKSAKPPAQKSRSAQSNARVPNEQMVKILSQNKVKVMFRVDGPSILLWCNYSALTKQKLGDGLEVWGRSQQILEHIKTTVFKFYPLAEITSEAANMHVVFALNDRQ